MTCLYLCGFVPLLLSVRVLVPEGSYGKAWLFLSLSKCLHVCVIPPNPLPKQIWNAAQERLPPDLRTTVIYGHDARRGLNLQPYTKGLDTGCVKGGPLTALVIEPRVGMPAAVSVVQ